MEAEYLADTSAWYWARAAEKTWLRLIDFGKIATCVFVEMEYLYSARSRTDYRHYSTTRKTLEVAPATEEVCARALEVQGLLADYKDLWHRSVQMADLLIAATAEINGISVLHYDEDFDRINNITKQPCEWLAPKGSLTR